MSKNIVICLDGTGNQFGEKKSNVIRLFRMLVRKPGEQVAFYDPGVGTMGDPMYKTWIARKTNKVLGLAFGRGLKKNLVEAYTYLVETYENGDKVFIFGFSRGAYTARALAGFIRNCGLFEKGSTNLIPYAMDLFLKKAPKPDPQSYYKVLSGFRKTYGRQFKVRNPKPGKDPHHYQLRIEFMGLFDTVKSYGWVRNPPILRGELGNASILHLRHALAIDERRLFFHQMHWDSSSKQDTKEAWFPGVHADVGGGYLESESGLAKLALEWMVHEAIPFGLKIDPFRYGYVLGKTREGSGPWKDEELTERPAPNIAAKAHRSLRGAWKIVQPFPKQMEDWQESRDRRTIKSDEERGAKKPRPLLVHQSVVDRMTALPNYRPVNLLGDPTDPESLPQDCEIEQTGPAPEGK